jgi:hypothetical protein
VRAALDVGPETLPLKPARTLGRQLLGHRVGEDSQPVVQARRRDVKDLRQRVAVRLAYDVLFEEHRQLGVVERHADAEHLRQPRP